MNAEQTALIALGANLPVGERTPEDTVLLAIAELRERTAGPVAASRLFRTPAFPAGAGPDFVNAAISMPWSKSPQELLSLLHDVEMRFGRTRMTRWEARILDLDLLAVGDLIFPNRQTQAKWASLPVREAAIQTPNELILPHPRLAERGFVLVPLADVAPNWTHPVTGHSVEEMLSHRPDAELREIWPLEPSLNAVSQGT